MNIETIKQKIPSEAKDILLNLESVLSEDGTPDLTERQTLLIALASAYAAKHPELIQALQNSASAHFVEADFRAVKSAAAIMAMNNVYYRFIHLASDKSYGSMPARLRMNVIANPGIDKNDFELCCLAVSALNGCGMCMESHVHEVVKGGVSKQGAQSAIRIAAVINAAAQAIVSG